MFPFHHPAASPNSSRHSFPAAVSLPGVDSDSSRAATARLVLDGLPDPPHTLAPASSQPPHVRPPAPALAYPLGQPAFDPFAGVGGFFPNNRPEKLYAPAPAPLPRSEPAPPAGLAGAELAAGETGGGERPGSGLGLAAVWLGDEARPLKAMRAPSCTSIYLTS